MRGYVDCNIIFPIREGKLQTHQIGVAKLKGKQIVV